MFEQLTERASQLAQARRARRIAALAEQVGDDLPDVALSVDADGLVLEGRGLLRRVMSDARLRAIGLFAKGAGS